MTLNVFTLMTLIKFIRSSATLYPHPLQKGQQFSSITIRSILTVFRIVKQLALVYRSIKQYVCKIKHAKHSWNSIVRGWRLQIRQNLLHSMHFCRKTTTYNLCEASDITARFSFTETNPAVLQEYKDKLMERIRAQGMQQTMLFK